MYELFYKMNRFKKIARNKSFLALVFFIVWMSFFDPKDWSTIASKKEKLKNLQESEANLNNQITETRIALSQLKTSAETIETYAREKYMMKKDNEDVFLVKPNE